MVNFAQTDAFKEISLESELRTATRLIELGLGELQNMNNSYFYHLPFQLLASGIERLMKCHICYGHHENEGQFPSFKDLKNKGHDLLTLKQTIVGEYYITKDIPLLEEDLNYITNDEDLQKILDMLSEFGKYARYYNFDVVTNNEKPIRNVEDEWERFETNLALRNPDQLNKLVSGNPDEQREANEQIKRYIVMKLERCLGVIARQFTMGNLGELAQRHSVAILPYLSLYDNKLGKTDYRKSTTRYQSTEPKSHRRNMIDYFNRRFNKNYKYLKINKGDLVDNEWPFYVDSVIIECRYSRWCVVSVDGYDYSLNGIAKRKYKLENPHEGGVAIPGIGVGKLIQMALELGKTTK